jgi:hypothetical protein
MLLLLLLLLLLQLLLLLLLLRLLLLRLLLLRLLLLRLLLLRLLLLLRRLLLLLPPRGEVCSDCIARRRSGDQPQQCVRGKGRRTGPHKQNSNMPPHK